MTPSIRRMLMVAGMAALAVVVVVALMAGIGLNRAHHVLTRAGYSQEQLAIATELEAGVNAYAARAALGTSHAEGRQRDARQIASLLGRYAVSIRAEHLLLTTMGDTADDAANELATVRQLGTLFTRMRSDIDAGAARDPHGLSRDLDLFQALVRVTVEQERVEVGETVASFDRTRTIVRMMAIALPLFSGIAGVVGLCLLLARLKHPLRRFEDAMAAVGRGDTVPLNGLGFAEFDGMAAGFDRMAREIEAQRTAVAEVNARLEREVMLRTAELQARNAQLAEIEANRRLFFAQISHELRTPITALQCEAEVALRTARSDGGLLRQALEQVLVQGAFIRRRLSDLLAVSQAEDGKLVMAREGFDLADAVRGSLIMAKPFASANETRIDATIAPHAFPIDGDAGWMQQALLALLDNAIKFSPDAAVTIGLARYADEAILIICDHGPGVPEEALHRLFDRFHQEPAGRARGGSGLGLSVARWVVDHHQGRIAAANQPGGGLRITIALPLQRTSQ